MPCCDGAAEEDIDEKEDDRPTGSAHCWNMGQKAVGKGRLTLSVDAMSNLAAQGRAVSPIQPAGKVSHDSYATSPDIEPTRGEKNTRPSLLTQGKGHGSCR
jgi:hypothetical protein